MSWTDFWKIHPSIFVSTNSVFVKYRARFLENSFKTEISGWVYQDLPIRLKIPKFNQYMFSRSRYSKESVQRVKTYVNIWSYILDGISEIILSWWNYHRSSCSSRCKYCFTSRSWKFTARSDPRWRISIGSSSFASSAGCKFNVKWGANCVASEIACRSVPATASRRTISWSYPRTGRV